MKTDSIAADRVDVSRTVSLQAILRSISNFKIIPQLDQYPSVVQFAQTMPGKLLIVLLFSLGLYINQIAFWKELGVILAILSVFPRHRKVLIIGATLYWLFDINYLHTKEMRDIAVELGTAAQINWDLFRTELVVFTLMFCVVFYQLAANYRNNMLMHRPVATLIIFYLSIIAIACYAPLPEIVITYLWAFIILFKRFIWFLGYSLLDIRSKQPTPFVQQLGYYQAFWHGSFLATLPFPKGAAYLKKIETKTPDEFAVCQLKGLKLLYWAFILMVAHTVYLNVVFGEQGMLFRDLHIPFSLNISHIGPAIHASVMGNPLPWYEGWLSLFAKLINVTFYTAIMGHIIIACVRMTGFYALRSTYRPFQAKTLAEFWNRYFYYFKEFLVEFFFYPVYLRYFKKHPRLRIFFATLAAAGFGNVLFHFLYSPINIYELGLWQAVIKFQVYIFYGLLFGSVLALSQLKNHRHRGEYPWHRKWITGPICVVGFFAFVIIFDDIQGDLTLVDHFRFTLSLFGLQG